MERDGGLELHGFRRWGLWRGHRQARSRVFHPVGGEVALDWRRYRPVGQDFVGIVDWRIKNAGLPPFT
jgi:hypothetical protein